MRGLIAIIAFFLGLTFAAQADQPDAISEFYAGHAALQQGDPQQAIEHFSKALQIGKLEQTQIAYVHHYRAIAYQRLDRHQEAIDDYTQALAIGTLPQRVQAAIYYNRAIALDHLGNFDRAIKDYTQAIANKPDYAEAYMNRGNAYRKLGDNDAALRDYEASASYGNPIKQLPYYGEGLVLEAKGDKPGAFKAFQTALLLAPDFEPARLKVEGYQAAGMTPSIASGMTGAIKPVAEPVATAAAATPVASDISPVIQPAKPATSVVQASASPAAMPAPGSNITISSAAPGPGLALSSGASSSGTPATLATPSALGSTPPTTNPAKPTVVANVDKPAMTTSAKPKTEKVAKPKTRGGPGSGGAAVGPAPVDSTLPAAADLARKPAGTSGAIEASTPAAVPVGEPAAAPSTVATVTPASTMTAPGSAAVTAPSPAPAATSERVASNGGSFLVQLGAYTSEDQAHTQATQIVSKNSDALNGLTQDIQKADLGAKGTYYRLRFGPFATKQEAAQRCTQLKTKGQACIIVAGAAG